MARDTVTIGGRRIPAVALWAAGVAAFVLIVPMLTFAFREFPGLSRDVASGPAALPLKQAGVQYAVSELFSLGSTGPGSTVPRTTGPQERPAPYLDVVAPAADGSVWVCDFPPGWGAVGRARRYTPGGTLEASFATTVGATLFTPGGAGHLWVDVASGSGRSERIVHYGPKGEVIRVYPMPEGFFARGLIPGPDGIYALAEEWNVDPDTKDVDLKTALVPVALAPDLEPPPSPSDAALEGAFFGADGNLYRVRSKGPVPEGTIAPAYEVTAWSKAGSKIATYSLPPDVRPFAADAQGRVYAEKAFRDAGDAPGLVTLGDSIDEVAVIWVIERDGKVTKVPVWRPAYYSQWAPSAWPMPDGTLVGTAQTADRLRVLKYSPGVRAEAAAEAPFTPQLTLIEPRDPGNGDPYLVEDDAQRDLMRLVYSGLVSMDASLQPVPDLAERVPTKANGLVSADGLTVRWEIRDGVTWHDGQPAGPEDVVATWEYLRDREVLPHREPFPGSDAIESVRAEGRSVTVKLRRPIGVAPVAFFPYVLPAHLLPATSTANPAISAAPVGTGPYRLVRWEEGAGWYLRAHERTPRGAPAVASVHVVFAISAAARAAYASAQTPAVWDWVDEIQTGDLHVSGMRVQEHLSGRWWGMLFNAADGPTADPVVRRAISDAYPATVLRSQYYEAAEASAPVDAFPTVSAAHDPSRKLASGDDTRAAAALLREAGWSLGSDGHLRRDGVVLEVQGRSPHRQWNDSEVPPDAGDAIHLGWREFGILDRYDFSSHRHYDSWWRFGGLTFDEFDVGLGVFPSSPDPGWGGVFDPRDTPSRTDPYGRAVTGTRDGQLADLYARAEAEYDPVKRAEIGRAITKRAFDELDLAIGERYEMRRIAVSGPVSGLVVGPLPSGAFSDVTSWSVEQPKQ